MLKYDGHVFSVEERICPHERAVAISVGGSSHAVMMTSPADLEDFAYGFLLTDGVISHADQIEDVEIVEGELGIDIQVRLMAELAENYRERRRALVGPVGCGLCGIESLELAVPELVRVKPARLFDTFPWQALEELQRAQRRREKTGALHGAALLDGEGALVLSREDIGRHNALDKVIGAGLRNNITFEGKVAVLSSRVSLDLVIKTVRAGIGTLIARASPSDLAVKYAENWGLNLIAPVFEKEYFQSGAKYEHNLI